MVNFTLTNAVAIVSGGVAGGVVGDVLGLGDVGWFKENPARPMAAYFLFGALALLTPSMIKDKLGKIPVPLVYFLGSYSMGVAYNMYKTY